MAVKERMRKLLGMQEFSVFLVLIVIYILVGVIQPRWFNWNVFNTILLFMPYVLLLALGEMAIIINRNVDTVSYTHLDVYKRQEKGRITAAILELKNRGCELIIATGGMLSLIHISVYPQYSHEQRRDKG